MAGISKRSLRAMEMRWARDLARLEAAWPEVNWDADEPRIETIRNLATAILQIQMEIGKQVSA
jgi:hypothetical protein